MLNRLTLVANLGIEGFPFSVKMLLQQKGLIAIASSFWQ